MKDQPKELDLEDVVPGMGQLKPWSRIEIATNGIVSTLWQEGSAEEVRTQMFEDLERMTSDAAKGARPEEIIVMEGWDKTPTLCRRFVFLRLNSFDTITVTEDPQFVSVMQLPEVNP